jgi:glycosyltransferase involved in cell wall biosynthesis
MRHLVIAPQPFFTPRGTPLSVYYRTLVLSELGADIDLLTYGEGRDPDIPNVRVLRIPRFACLGNVKTGPSFLKLFLDIFVAARAVILLVRNRYDVVHAHEEAVFFSRFLKPLFRFKLVYDMHSSLPQQLTNFDFTDSRIIHYVFKKLEISCINAADAVITICPDLRDYVNQIIGDRDKHFLIENSIFELVKLKDGDPFVAGDQWSNDVADIPSGRFCFVYTGTLEAYQGIDVLIRAFPRVVERNPDAFLLVAGGSSTQVDHFRALAKAERLEEHCLFTGNVPQKLANAYMERADVLLSPRTEGTNTPLKIYQKLASGIPLVATNTYSHTQVLDDEVAFLADPEPEAFGEAMITAMIDKSAARLKAENASRRYDEKYSRESYVKKLSAVLSALRACVG